MKQGKQFLLGAALLSIAPMVVAQQLYNKEYRFADPGPSDQIFTTTEYINDGVTEGHLMVSSSIGGTQNTPAIIQRVDNEGNQIWSTMYDPPGSASFDRDVLIKNKRAGVNPDNGRMVAGGQITATVNNVQCPAYIELDPGTGDVLREEYFYTNNWLNDPYPGDGHINAVHTVESGTHAGVYMVGQIVIDAKFTINAPILIRRGSTSDFEYYYDLDLHRGMANYLDVDVDEYEGDIIAVGYDHLGTSAEIAFGSRMIVDVFDNSGALTYTHAYNFNECRLTSVKSIGPGRALVAGSVDKYYGIIMEINIYSGDVIWAREAIPGDLLDGTPEPIANIGEIIEVELDNEAMPVILAIETPDEGQGQDPVGPGLFARLDNNGVTSYAMYQDIPRGFADLEPQIMKTGNFANLEFVASLTGINGTFVNSLAFHQSNQAHSTCLDDLDLDMKAIDWFNRDPGKSKIRKALEKDDNGSFDFDPYSTADLDACCQLPWFNPLPWNHPWQATYGISSYTVDAGTGWSSYTWDYKYTKNIWTGGDETNTGTTIPYQDLPTNPHKFVIPLQNGSSINTDEGIPSSEKTRIEITVDDGTGCLGWDATYVHVSDDGVHNRPDYSLSANDHEYPNYGHCQQNNSNPLRHLYVHEGWGLGSTGFPGLSGPEYELNPSVGFNYLHTSNTTIGDVLEFDEIVNDSWSSTTNYVETDVEILPCNCSQTPAGIDKIDDDERVIYSLIDRDLPIVKYAWSLKMSATGQPDKYTMVKRREMRKRSSGSAIQSEDFLLPTVDDRYMDSYPLYAGNQTLYLDLWFTDLSTTPNYPYDICDHTRIQITNASVKRKGRKNESGESTSIDDQQDELIWKIVSTEMDYNVFPNPSNGLFQIQGVNANTNIVVKDAQGRIVKDMGRSTDIEYVQVDMQSSPNGIYFLELTTESGEVLVEKLVKQ